MVRVEYNLELENLRGSVVAMASMADKAIARAMDALQRQDVALAEQVIIADRAINRQTRCA